MRRPALLRTATALLAVGLFSVSTLLQASGGDEFSENPFMPQYHVPSPELQEYAAGRIGIVAPSYWRVYQFLAYRSLTGQSLSKAELAALNLRGYAVGPDTGGYDYAYSEEKNGVGAWLKARAAVNGAAPVEVGVDTDVGDFSSIINCPSDAFDRATKTLTERIAKGGQQWAAVWLASQDAVFANCSPKLAQEQRNQKPLVRPLVLPPALPAKAPDWLKKDHAYQRAAAHFYAGRYEDARTQFLAVGQDAASPWQPLGKYLAARSLIRAAVAVPGIPESDDDKRALRDRLGKARAELVALAPTYAPARQLVTWIDIRVRPEERRVELSNALAAGPVIAGSVQMLTDYLFLMDKLAPDQMMGASDPMTAWIGVMQAGSSDRYADRDDHATGKRRLAALEIARAQWNKKPDAAWLVALLTNARGKELKAAERKAAMAAKADTPAFVALQYHLARLALEEGNVREADAMVTALLRSPLPPSARNRVLRLKMVSANSAEAFLAAAPRVPADVEVGVPIADEAAQRSAPQFDSDLRAHLEQHMPLATLVKLKPALPASEQREVAEMLWTRAVLLGQYAIADAYTDELAKGRETTRHLYVRYRNAATPEAKRDAALLILANTPELVPQVSGKGNANGGATYWSCYNRELGDDGMDGVTPAFLATAERAQAQAETTQLRALPKRSAYLIPLAIEWAKANKADPEAPKALHFLIASTRNQCSAGAEDKSGRKYSKEAFDFLHRQYPKNEWTAKTRYYY